MFGQGREEIGEIRGELLNGCDEGGVGAGEEVSCQGIWEVYYRVSIYSVLLLYIKYIGRLPWVALRMRYVGIMDDIRGEKISETCEYQRKTDERENEKRGSFFDIIIKRPGPKCVKETWYKPTWRRLSLSPERNYHHLLEIVSFSFQPDSTLLLLPELDSSVLSQKICETYFALSLLMVVYISRK